jgi:hypothetical protein
VLDGDDYLLRGRIARLLARAADWDFVADDLLQVHEQRIGCEAPVPVLFGSWFEPRPLSLEVSSGAIFVHIPFTGGLPCPLSTPIHSVQDTTGRISSACAIATRAFSRKSAYGRVPGG